MSEGDAPDPGPLAAELRRRLGPPPELPRWPSVSVVVASRDGAPLLRRLLAGLSAATDYPDLELIVVDNASADDSLELIRNVEAPFPISFVANTHNESFSDACNQGAALASGELLLFLNNDTIPFEPGWLRELVACLCGGEAAMVGPTLIQPGGGDSSAPDLGYVVHQRGLRAREEASGTLVPAFRDHLDDPLGSRLGEDVETIIVAAACLLVAREDFERVGGFARGYWYGPEDADFGLKLRERGQSACISGRALLIHPPNTTLDTVASAQRQEWQRGNRRRFAERWGARLRREFNLDRLRGGGLWAEPRGAAAAEPAEVEALGFCLKAASSVTGEVGADVLEALAAELRRRGHRCLSLAGAEAEASAALEFDVAVHLAGARYAPNPAQLNLLWSADDRREVPAIERSRYDLALSCATDGSPASVERLARRLVEASVERAEEIGFRTRIGPDPPPSWR